MNHTHRSNCRCAGKSPIIPNWQQHEHTTPQDVEQWFTKNPSLNIGLPLGQVSGIVGIDVDGHDNLEKLNELSGGNLPDTWEYTTGNGYRILYQLPPGTDTKKFTMKLEEGEIAILCDGQQTVMPPSKHPNGNNYTWKLGKSPQDIPISTSPDWVMKMIIGDAHQNNGETEVDLESPEENTVTDKDWQKKVGKGERNNHLTRLAGSLVARGIPKEQVTLFLKSWNQEYCDPPIEESDIIRMVEGLALTEEMKKAKRGQDTASGKKKTKPFRPTPIANAFFRNEEREGRLWCYSSRDGSFYKTQIDEGPWKRVDIEEIYKYVRNFIIDPNKGGEPTWDSQRHVRELVDASKALLLDTTGDVIFDLGEQVELGQFDVLKYIHVANGLLDWETAELHPWDPEFHTTIQLPIEWEGIDAECPTWEDALEDWLPDKDTREFIQEYVGLCLIPDTRYRTAVFLYGEGSNGKGLFLDTVTKLFGDALVAIPLNRLTSRFETGNLQNKLINICGDIDATYIKETGALKALIGGDILRGERKYSKSFDFRPVARLLFSANKLPKVADKTRAWYSRWKFIKFPNIFPVNPTFKMKFTKAINKELPGILAWAVKGLLRLEASNKFTVSTPMKESEDQYKETNDSVLYFLSDCCQQVEHDGKKTTYSQRALWRTYSEWCEQEGLKAVGMREFGRRVRNTGIDSGRRNIRSKTCMCMLGIQLNDDWQGAYEQYEALQ